MLHADRRYFKRIASHLANIATARLRADRRSGLPEAAEARKRRPGGILKTPTAPKRPA